jgi:hypothetical protein
MDFSRFKLFDCFEAASIKQWARETLPTIPPPPFSSGARREMEAIIAEKANLVERLLEKVNVELEELVKCSAIISPYRMIPHEILGNIINVPYLEADALMLNPRRRCRPSTHLTVCMSWSQVALSQPRIWLCNHMPLALNICSTWKSTYHYPNPHLCTCQMAQHQSTFFGPSYPTPTIASLPTWVVWRPGGRTRIMDISPCSPNNHVDSNTLLALTTSDICACRTLSLKTR